MNQDRRAPRLASLLLPAAMLALGACESTSPTATTSPPQTRSAEISNEFTATAEVIAVVPEQRRVVLRREDGTPFAVVAGQEVRNFERIKVGSTVRVRYRETLAAALLPPGTQATPTEGTLTAARAAAGERPAAGVGVTIRMRVKIESIDRERNIVIFSRASGEMIARRIVTPQGRDFVKGLKVGDTVQLDYAEAAAITVEDA